MRPDFYWSMVYWSHELRQHMGRHKQQVFYAGASMVGLLLYLALYASVTGGVMWLAGIGSVFLTITVFALLVMGFEVNAETHKVRPIYHRGQSYLFMAGPILMPVLLMLTAQVWSKHWNELAMERSWLWFWGGFVLIGAFGVLFHLVDSGRYTDPSRDAASMLKSPSKWWLNKWQMPVSLTLVAVTVAPTWWIPSSERPWTIGVTVFCVVLAVLDGLRNLDPFEQHVQWDAVHFKRVWQG